MERLEGLEVRKGERFIIGTQSYSNTQHEYALALRDITIADWEEMREEIDKILEGSDTYFSSYDFIAPWLHLKGFISKLEYPKTIHFHYEHDIKTAYIPNSLGEETEFAEKLELIRKFYDPEIHTRQVGHNYSK